MEAIHQAEFHENHLIGLWPSSLVSSPIDVGLAGVVVPIQSAVLKVADLASSIQPKRCRGHNLRKESRVKSSSEGGSTELLRSSLVQSLDMASYPSACPCYSQLPQSRASHLSPFGWTHSGPCGLGTQSLGGWCFWVVKPPWIRAQRFTPLPAEIMWCWKFLLKVWKASWCLESFLFQLSAIKCF